MNGRGFGTAPVKEGDEIDVKIEAIGDKGDGIAKKDGFVIVVPGTQVNDEVKVRITKVLKRVGFAEVVGDSQGSSESEEEPNSEPEEEPVQEEAQEVAQESEKEESDEEPVDSEDFGEEEKQ